MAVFALPFVVPAGQALYTTLFVGSAVGAGAAGGYAINKMRESSEAEPAAAPATQKEKACSTCKDPKCKQLEEEMKHIVERRKGEDGVVNRGLRERAEQFASPKQSLETLERAGGGRGQKPGGHTQAWSDTQNQLAKKMREWEQAGCADKPGEYPPGMEEWATRPPPKPGEVNLP